MALAQRIFSTLASLTDVSGQFATADLVLYTTAENTFSSFTVTAAGRALVDDADAAAQRTTLGASAGVWGYSVGGTAATTQAAARVNLGGAKVFASGGALSAGTPDVAGQLGIAADGAAAFAFSTSAGGFISGAVSMLNPLYYFTGINVSGTSALAAVTATSLVTTGAVTVGGRLTASDTAGAGGHILETSVSVFTDNVLYLKNSRTDGHAAVAFIRSTDSTPGVGVIGVGCSGVSSEYSNRLYAAANPPGGVGNPIDITVAQEFDEGGGTGYITHRRLFFDGTAHTITAYAWSTSAVVGGVGWHVASDGRMGVGTSTLTAGAQLTVSGAIAMNVGSDATGDLYYRNASGLLTRLAVGTNTHVLTLAGGLPTWAAPSGVTAGSIDNAALRADGTGGSTSQGSAIVIRDYTTSTQNNVVIAADDGSTTNIGLVLSPKGTGAFNLGPRPDGTSTGGNARGGWAVDLQLLRNAANRVASGTASFVAASQDSLATNTYSVAMGGDQNNCSGSSAMIAGGSNNTASQTYAFVGGGQNCTVSGEGASGFGFSATSNRNGQQAVGAGNYSAQSSLMNAWGRTTDATPLTLLLGRNGVTQRITIASGMIMAGTVHIVGVKSDGSAVSHFMRKFSIKNVGGTTSLVNSETIGTDVNAGGCAVAVTADNTNDALDISVTGIAAETWRWEAMIHAGEIAYGA